MNNILHPLPPSVSHLPSPNLFTYPFNYTPHPLCIAAAQDIMPLCRRLLQGESSGKMFGVLVVEQAGSRYYLAAFSGQLAGSYLHDGFVPPVYNLLHPTSHFRKEEAIITSINNRIRQGEDTPALRTERRERSVHLQQWLFTQFNFLNAQGETQNLLQLFADQSPILTAEEYFNRKAPSAAAPQREKPTSHLRVPSGAGECCAPKLLQYAFSHQLRPVCMAEFWLGPSPREMFRTDGLYYPACHAKCRPILAHMLKGLSVEENPLLALAREKAAQVEYVYADSDILVVCKPEGLISTPGKDDIPSLEDFVRLEYPTARAVHRLDMDTSGLLLLALNYTAFRNLQDQFYRQTVRKEYIALLDGTPTASLPAEGTITLPLLHNPYDRPRQMVSNEHGKRAVTHYRLLSPEERRILFAPQTGRTHQLRVHAAHPDGLGCPIKGDPLYGTPADRLYLHAQRLEFAHPTTGAPISFFRAANF